MCISVQNDSMQNVYMAYLTTSQCNSLLMLCIQFIYHKKSDFHEVAHFNLICAILNHHKFAGNEGSQYYYIHLLLEQASETPH